MNVERLTRRQVIQRIRKVCAALATQADAAKALGVSAQYLNDVLAGRREPGPKILKKLRIRKIIDYQPLSERDGDAE